MTCIKYVTCEICNLGAGKGELRESTFNDIQLRTQSTGELEFYPMQSAKEER